MSGCNPANTKKCQGVITAVSGYGKEGKEGTGDPEGLPLWGKEGKKGTPHTLYLTPLKAV